MSLVKLSLKCRNTGEKYERMVSPMREVWRHDPQEFIAWWIAEHGNAQHSTRTHPADLECVSFETIAP